MSTEEANVPKRRSSAANRRRRKRGTAAVAAPTAVQDNVQESTSQATAEAEVPVERHLQRREERKAAKAKKDERKGVARVVDTQRFSGVQRFYHDTMSEIRKVIWPDRYQTRNLTLVVIALSVVMGLLLGGIDWVLLQLFETIG